MALNRRPSLPNGPGGFQSLRTRRVALLCVALSKSVAWNFWTDERRQRREGVLCNCACLGNIHVVLREAGLAGRRTLRQAVAMSMGVVQSIGLCRTQRGGGRIYHVTGSFIKSGRQRTKDTTTTTTLRGHVASSIPSVSIRYAALQPHTLLCKVESGGSVAPVREPSLVVYVCVRRDVDRLIWGVQRFAAGRTRGRSSNGRGTRSACDPDGC